METHYIVTITCFINVMMAPLLLHYCQLSITGVKVAGVFCLQHCPNYVDTHAMTCFNLIIYKITKLHVGISL